MALHVVAGADRVHDEARREVSGACGDGSSGGQPLRIALGPDPPALLEDLRAAPPVDRPVDASAPEQRGVGGVDDHVHLLGGDVALDQRDPCHGTAPGVPLDREVLLITFCPISGAVSGAVEGCPFSVP